MTTSTQIRAKVSKLAGEYLAMSDTDFNRALGQRERRAALWADIRALAAYCIAIAAADEIEERQL